MANPQRPNDQNRADAAIPVWTTDRLAYPEPTEDVPATVAGGVTYDTGTIASNGYKVVAVAAKLSQAGVLTLQRYIDVAGTLPLGLPIEQVMAANVLATIWVNDGQPMASFDVTLQNTSGSVGNVSDFTILQSS